MPQSDQEKVVGTLHERAIGITPRSTQDAISTILEGITDATFAAFVEHSSDFIGIASLAGRFLFVNPAGQQMVGLDGLEQVQATVILDYVAEEDRERFQADVLPTVIRQGYWAGETQFRHFKTGTALPMRQQIFVIKDGKNHRLPVLATISRNIVEQKRIETTVRDIAEGVSSSTGEAFFHSLVQYLAKTLAADYAFVGAVSHEHSAKVRTVAVSADGQIVPNFEYDLQGTPCENVLGETLCVYPEQIQSHFPHDHLLVEMGVEGYVGTPLFDSQEHVCGLMVVLSRRPLEHPELCASTLRIFAARAAAELERKQAEEALRLSEERFAKAFHASPEPMAIRRQRDQTWLEVNERWVSTYGYSREEVIGRRYGELQLGSLEDLQKGILLMEKQGYVRDFEVDCPTKQGVVRRVSVSEEQIVLNNEPCYLVLHRDITERKRAEEQLRATNEQLRALMASLRSAREQEGIRIAREIHDALGSALTSLRWDLEEIDTTVSKAQDLSLVPAWRDKIRAMCGLIDSTTHVVRRIASELRPSILDDLGLAAALEWQAQQFQARTGIVCRYDGAGEHLDLNQEQATAIFRICQEALTNVLRHAHATRVDVTLEEEATAHILTIRDNGRGLTEDEQGGPHVLGLLGMRERAHLIGGRVDITGVRGQGTTVILRVPHASTQSVANSEPGAEQGQNHDENPAS